MFRASALLAAYAAVVLSIAAVVPARAQAPAPLVRPDPAPAPIAAPRAAAPAVRPQQVQVGELAAVDPSVAGLLDETNGGLGANMWAGSDRARIERLLPRLPMGTLSPSIQDLARRLLLSAAAVPEGAAVAPSLLGLRVERLMAGGHIAEVNELLELAAAAVDDPALSRAEVDAMLLAGDNAGACGRVPGLVRSDPRPYWIKALAFCRALDNDAGAVSLALALLRDQGQAGDQAFFTLIAALTGDGQARVTTLIDPSPLHLAMLRAARQTIPADAVAGARPAILWAIATSPNDELSVRVDAAERAEAAGALSASVLADIYAAVPYSEDDIGVALQRAAEQPGAMSNALLYQAGVVWESEALRAAALQRSWQVARDSGAGFGTAARISLEQVRNIVPDAALSWFAHDAGRSLIAAGDIDLAWAWLETLQRAGATDAHALATARALWPLLQVADPEGAFMRDPGRARQWWRELPPAEDTAAIERRALLFTLYEALGDDLPEAAWDPLFAAPLTVDTYQPSPAVSHALRDAADAGRLGETVLLALLALGDSGSEGAGAATLHLVIDALRRVGLAAEARAIALEAALAQGL